MTAAGWLGVLRAHQSRVAEALALLRPAARGQVGVEHTSATLHSLLFTGHAHALAGRPAQALAAFTRYTAEVERRQVPRFAGRAVNFAGWVLRNLGAWTGSARPSPRGAGGRASGRGPRTSPSPRWRTWPSSAWIPATRTAPQARLDAGRGAAASATWCSAGGCELKHQLITGRLALAARRPGTGARRRPASCESRAAALGVPRYTSVARLLVHRANRALGLPVDLGAVAADLDLLDRCVAIEAWRWTCEVAADFGNRAWLDRAADRAARLARDAGRLCGRTAAGGGSAAWPAGLAASRANGQAG